MYKPPLLLPFLENWIILNNFLYIAVLFYLPSEIMNKWVSRTSSFLQLIILIQQCTSIHICWLFFLLKVFTVTHKHKITEGFRNVFPFALVPISKCLMQIILYYMFNIYIKHIPISWKKIHKQYPRSYYICASSRKSALRTSMGPTSQCPANSIGLS